MAARGPGKRTQGLLKLLEEEFDLHPIRELAVDVQRMVPVMHEGEPLIVNGAPVMVPWLDPTQRITALNSLADRTFPKLRSVEVALEVAKLPTVVLNMRGVSVERVGKPPTPRVQKKAPAKRKVARKKPGPKPRAKK